MRDSLSPCLAPGTVAREAVEAAIQAALDTAHRLIALLDDADGDPCAEIEEFEASAREWCGSGAHRFDVGAAA